MADISALVQYEKPFPVELEFAGDKVGITINMISFDSERVVKAVRPVDARRVAALYGPKAQELEPDQIVNMAEEADRERLVAAIVSWDFGGNSFDALPVDPECTEENKRYLINHANAGWVRDQLMAAGNNLQNFTEKPLKSSRRSSKSK